MRPTDLIDSLVTAAERQKRRSCFLCMKFRLRCHATLVLCEAQNVVYVIDSLPKNILKMCADHAKACNDYETEDV